MRTVQVDSSSEKEIIARAVTVLDKDGMIVYPTETVYGLGVDATNQKAVNTLLKFKGQRGRKPTLIAVSDQSMAEEYVELNDVARRLYRTFLPGPVAVVSRMKKTQNYKYANVQKRNYLALGIASLENTVGIRIPNYPLVLKIIRTFGKPITSTSANTSGSRNPWSINDILETTPKNKLGLIDLLFDAGPLPKRPPSTIIDTSREKTEIVREGTIKVRLKVLDSETRTRRAKGQGLKEETYISDSPRETMDIAKRLMNGLFRPSSFSPYPLALVLALQGPLGAGKTVFAKGIARALGVTDPIRSPSYTLVREYPLSLTRHQAFVPRTQPRGGPGTRHYLYHIDAWRLHGPSEFQDLGLDRMFKPGNVIVIEWIERLSLMFSSLQKKAIVVLVKIEVINDRERNIEITR